MLSDVDLIPCFVVRTFEDNFGTVSCISVFLWFDHSRDIRCTVHKDYLLCLKGLVTTIDALKYFYFWIKYDLGQKYYAPQVQPGWGSNS